jgi:hypothetical protein
MKANFLLILCAYTVLAIGQNLQQPKLPMHNLCKTMSDEKYPAGTVILNPNVVAVESPPYPQKMLGNRIESRVMVQVLVNQDGEVITATPISGSEHLWAASVKASVTARFDPKWLSSQTGNAAGILLFYFRNGKVELEKMPVIDPKDPTIPSVRRGITKP